MNYEDNYAATFRGILIKVIEQAPRGMRQQDIGHLHHIVETGEIAGSFSMTFIRAGTDAKLYVAFDLCGVKVDNAGNEWATFDVGVRINWPTHGSTQPGVSLARLDFYREVALFAAEIQSEFPAQVQRLMMTAQEIKDAAKKTAINRKVRTDEQES